MDQLQEGEHVLARDSSGHLHFSRVLLFLDVDEMDKRSYVEVFTESSGSPRLRLTEAHLLYVSDTADGEPQVEFAGKVRVGQYVHSLNPDALTNSTSDDGQSVAYLDVDSSIHLRPELITKVGVQVMRGAFAPLTEAGNLLVDSTLVSCYAQVGNQQLAHFAFLPIRTGWFLSSYMTSFWKWLHPSTESLNVESNDVAVSASIAGKPLAFTSGQGTSKEAESPGSSVDRTLPTNRRSASWPSNALDRRAYNSKLLQLQQSRQNVTNRSARVHRRQGMHWYARLLYSLAQLIIPSDYMYH
jgi:hypothetical protein